LIPKVNPSKDFRSYFKVLTESNFEEYQSNHDLKAEEEPFSKAQDV
jgi:hypothetical protein